MKLRLTAKILSTQINKTATDSTDEGTSYQRVYDYEPGRNEVPDSDRLPFDILKLIDAGVVYVTPPMDTNSESDTFKKWLEEIYKDEPNKDIGGPHLITLRNIKYSSKADWIMKAITEKGKLITEKDKLPKRWLRKDWVRDLYDGKYNQILWGLETLGIEPKTMLYQSN